MWFMMPVPLVSVRNCERKPISPRAGMRNSSRTRPLPWLTILVIVPRRVPACAMTTPWKSSATSMTRSSTGSITLPSTSLVTMSGRETCISNPSRRIISIRIESCSSPRPSTFICSGVSVGSTRIETLPSSSLSRRSLICREVTNWPSRPDIGEVLTPKIIDTVGSSMAMTGIALRCSMSAIVSPMVMSSMPGEADDVAGGGLLDLDPLQAVEGEQLGDLRVAGTCRRACRRSTGSPILTRAVEDAADGDAPEVVARVEVGDQHLQRPVRPCRAAAARARGSRRRAAAGPRRARPSTSLAVPALRARVDDREVELVLGGVEVDEQVVDLVEHLLRRARRAGRSC